MKGLLIKDFYMSKPAIKGLLITILGIAGFVALLVLAGKYGNLKGSFDLEDAGDFIKLFNYALMFLPISLVSEFIPSREIKSGQNKTIRAAPVSHKMLVQGRFVFLFICAGVGLSIGMLSMWVCDVAGIVALDIETLKVLLCFLLFFIMFTALSIFITNITGSYDATGMLLLASMVIICAILVVIAYINTKEFNVKIMAFWILTQAKEHKNMILAIMSGSAVLITTLSYMLAVRVRRDL